MATQEHVFADMKLSEVLVVLCDHQFTFEGLRSMTMTELYDALKRVNAGEIKSWAEVEAEEKAKRTKAAPKK
jgi:hypothetical protein